MTSCADIELRHREKLLKYAELLSSCVTARLTGTRGADELYRIHILDCLESVPYLPERGRAIDVGSGGGLPGLVWAICRPDLKFTLLDSIGKKCRAVQGIAEELGVKNAEIVCSRSEEYAKEHGPSFDFAGARAVADVGASAEMMSPLVKGGGTLLTFKGPRLTEELAEVKFKWESLRLSEPEIIPYGGEDSSKRFVIWKKMRRETPRADAQSRIKN